jgi:cysteine desulfuration protein SufE
MGKATYAYGRALLNTYRRTQASSRLENFIQIQAKNRGVEAFERKSFPQFPPALEPLIHRGEDVATEQAYPEALQEIIETFRSAAPEKRLEMLLAYALNLPDLPEELQGTRDTMEQVDECMTPIGLLAQFREGKVYYHIDVPRDAPTVRGFAGILYAGLNGATPAAIAATPQDLQQHLGLQNVLSPLRLRPLTALLSRMKRNARTLAEAA